MILISYNTCWYVYNFRLPLIRALKAQGHEVSVAAPRDEYTDRVIAEGVSFYDLPIEAKGKNPLNELKTLFEFRKAYKTLAPDVVLQYTIKPNLYGSLAARSLGIPAINNVTGLGEAFVSGGMIEQLVRFFYRAAFKKVKRVFFQNPDDYTLFLDARLVREEQAALLPGSGIDTDIFAPRERQPGPFTFLQVGRLLKAKGVNDFIAAARIVKKQRPDARFALLGRHDPEDGKCVDAAVLAAAESEGVVEHLGETDDVRSVIAQADCVVLPSYYREGTPRSLLEAASMAKPLIAADSVGTREPVTDGVNGFLHPPKDPAALAERMLRMIGLDQTARAAMGEASRTLMKERFDEKIVIDAYLSAVGEFL